MAEPVAYERIEDFMEQMVIRANNNRKEADHYKAVGRKELSEYFNGLCRGYIDAINEIGARLEPQMECYWNQVKYGFRERIDA